MRGGTRDGRRGARLELEQDLAELTGLRHVRESGLDLVRREDAIDDAVEPPLGDRVQQMTAEGLHRGGLLLERSGTQHGADDPAAPAGEGAQRELGRVAAAATD